MSGAVGAIISSGSSCRVELPDTGIGVEIEIINKGSGFLEITGSGLSHTLGPSSGNLWFGAVFLRLPFRWKLERTTQTHKF